MIRHIIGLCRAVGILRALTVLFLRLFNYPGAIKVNLKPLNEKFKVFMRPTDSDLFVASQVFGWKDYNLGSDRHLKLNELATKWRENGITPVIIDGGANIGYSSLYFSIVFPEAKILAIEPDPKTFELLQKNISNYPRIKAINAVLWTHDQGMALAGGENGSWSCHVAPENTAQLTRVNLPSKRLTHLLDSTKENALIIKLDIEGAEREVLIDSIEMLTKTPCIIIEPHDFMLPGSGCLEGLFNAINGKKVDTLLIGENIAIIDSSLCSKH